MTPDLIPALDATPIPGPVWLFQTLLVVTFYLHALFMSLALGGALLAAVAQVGSRGRAGDPRTVVARRLAAMNAYGISFAITTGIAPLLFAQVLYPQSFYTATLLVAWAWLGMLAFLALGYYAFYLYKLRGLARLERRGTAGGTAWLVVSAILFLAIACVHVAVNLIHSQPEIWARVSGSPWRVIADPTFGARLTHFVLGAVGMAAVVVAWWAVRQSRRGTDPGTDASVARYSWRWLVAVTALQLVDGMLLVLLLPGRVLDGLVDAGVRGLWPPALGLLLALALLLLLVGVRDPVERPRSATGVLALAAVTTAVMTLVRHQVRDLSLAPLAGRTVPAVDPQWGNFALFGVCLVLALATVAWMVRRVVLDRATGEEAA